jgi:hypothetical protein
MAKRVGQVGVARLMANPWRLTNILTTNKTTQK